MFARDLLHLNNVVLSTEHLEQSDDYANKIENWEGGKKFGAMPVSAYSATFSLTCDLGSNQHWISGFVLAETW